MLFFSHIYFTRMTKSKKRRTKHQRAKLKSSSLPVETRAGEALTVFWTVTVLTVLATNVVTLFAHFYVIANPTAEKMVLLKGLLMFTGSLVGGVSLVVLPILYRIRIVPLPPGLAVFGACAAAAPILAALVGAFR